MVSRATKSDADARAFLGRLEYAHKRGQRAPGAYQQGYQGARRDRLNAEWMPGNQAPDVLHRADARLLRERARDLYENNPMAKAAVNAYVANVVRCGVEPKPKRKVVDGDARKDWIEKYELWTARDADVTRVQHFNELQALWLTEVLVGGGCLVHFVYLPARLARGRRLPLCVELISEERFCEEGDMVGLSVAGKLENGNRFVRGIEVDALTGEPVAYWLKRGMPNDLFAIVEKPMRIPAEQCVYGFNRTRIGQHRGFTMLAPVITWLSRLGYYTDNELMASAIRSCFALMIKTEGEPWAGMSGPDGTPSEDLYGNQSDRIEPGIISHLRPGEDVTPVGPNIPPGDAETWVKLIQRSIAVGMDLSYFGMMRDTADSNFAGFRAGLNEDRSRYEMWQDRLRFKFVEPTYQRFVESASLAGVEGYPTPSQYASDPDHWNSATYQAPGWVSVTPLDDAKADEINVNNGFDSRTRVVGRRGEERSEIFEELAQEEEQAEALDINITAEPPAAEEVTSGDRR